MTRNLTLDDQLCFALYGASMAVTRLYKPMLDQLGMTYPQYLVLHVLWEEDGRSIGSIAQRLGLEPSTITPLVKRMEAAGFLTRTRRPDDERSVSVNLTAKGRAIRQDSRCLGQALFARSGLTQDELIGLNQKIQRLRHTLEQPPES